MLKIVEEAKALAASWIRPDESFATDVYPDPGDGSRRVGYGSKCPDEMDECGWETAELMLIESLKQCAIDVRVLLGPDVERGFKVARLAVLYCMAYQLGYTGLCGFKRMIEATFQGDFDTAADEMLDSRWHTQTPERCERLALIFRRGRE